VPAIANSSKSRLQPLQSPKLKRLPWLVHGFSTRRGGFSKVYGGHSLNLGLTKDDSPESVKKNREHFLRSLNAAGRRPWNLISLKQIHSDVIHVVRSAKPQKLVGDGLVTNLPNVALAIQTADCFPVLLIDPRHKAVGAFHAGWRGTVKRIVEKGLGIMRHEFGTLPTDVLAVIGPGIHKCCYEIGDEVKNQFESQFAYARELMHELYCPDPIREKYPLLFLNVRPPGHGDTCTKLYLDLAEANRRQLIMAGVSDDQISILQHCTSCNTKKFFSHRKEQGKTGRMMAVVGIKSAAPQP